MFHELEQDNLIKGTGKSQKKKQKNNFSFLNQELFDLRKIYVLTEFKNRRLKKCTIG